MKTVRFITIMIVTILILSAWTPTTAYAKADAAQAIIGANGVNASADFATVKLAKLTITNNTGGTIYLALAGTRSYYFAATKQGKNIFMIEPGKYTVTIRASACGGVITKKIKGGGSLGAYRCRK